MKGQRAQRSQQRAKETKKEEKPESYSKPEPDTKKACSRYRELAADHRPSDQAAGEPPEQATRSPEQQIRLTSQLRTL